MEAAQVALPLQLAVQLVATDAETAEGGGEEAAIGRRRAGGVGMRGLMPLVRDLLGGCLLPAQLAGLAVEREHDELMVMVRRRCLYREIRIDLGQIRWIGAAVGLDGGYDENLIP